MEVMAMDRKPDSRRLSLLASPFLLQELRLRPVPVPGTLLGDDVGAALAPLSLRTLARTRTALQLEMLASRLQLQVLQRTRPRRVRLATSERWLWARDLFLDAWCHHGLSFWKNLYINPATARYCRTRLSRLEKRRND
jgi:hypothetical protein